MQTKIVKSVVTDINGVICASCEMKLNYSEPREKTLSKIAECVMETIKKSGVGIDKIAYMCIGTPGMDFKYYEENLNKAFGFWASIDRKHFSLQKYLKFPVINENIAKLGAIAELKFGFGKHIQNYLYIYVDDGMLLFTAYSCATLLKRKRGETSSKLRSPQVSPLKPHFLRHAFTVTYSGNCFLCH